MLQPFFEVVSRSLITTDTTALDFAVRAIMRESFLIDALRHDGE
jgi:hypothetical protein